MAIYGSGSGLTNTGGIKSTQVFTSNGTWTRPSGITKIRVICTGGGGGGGCLLYTSPSPRDKRQSRMPSSA